MSEQAVQSDPPTDDNNWGYCTEQELEQLMLKKLEKTYEQAIEKLLKLGYNKDLVTKAILKKGYCHGNDTPLNNIVNNAIPYLNKLVIGRGTGFWLDDTKQCFDSLEKLREFSLACLVCLLRRVRIGLSRGDAMWCLLMCELDVGKASVMDVVVDDGEGDGKDGMAGVSLESCKFHGGWGFRKRAGGELEVERPVLDVESVEAVKTDVKVAEWSLLSDSKYLLMKSNVEKFGEEYWANLKKKQGDSEVGPGDMSSQGLSGAHESLEVLSAKNQAGTDSVLKKLGDLNLEGDKENVAKDDKDAMLLSLMHEIMSLEKQVKERKEWAHQKAMQAARKLSHDLTELKILRMEKEVNRLAEDKEEKLDVDDPTMQKLSEMETSLKRASSQVDRANLAVRRLEAENAEIKAEMEASRLSASESVTMCLAVARREKKYLKKLLAWEKQRTKLQEDITTEKQKLIELQDELVKVEAAKKTAEAKWRKEQKAKEYALGQVEKERRLKEATEANNKRRMESLRSKIEMDFQRYKDDLQRLEQELSQIQTSSDPDQQLTYSYGSRLHTETIASLLIELDDLDEKTEIDRACIFCQKDEVSIVFLPCAHQVLCGSCNEGYGKKGNAKCPTCRVVIEQRIRVYGASS
ncbi:Zinc finger, RING/FYVE/PHD-type [Artemisia annua]|uniref:Zinc finger, RING/FYVE/PHD-type n=1 Tax=Artemisia annua TaxID=35608 RepID=A0A2U1Q7P5_ARTAN|nr:Zinc finger, RING/FYVE/PHD-type [Artemisia annua]